MMFWCEDTPVYVYGAGLKGKIISDLLIRINCNFCGFLDRTAKNGSMGLSVFHPNELSMEQRKKSIVICSVANVFEHRKIASVLAELGYVYIIYKAVDNDWEGNKEIIDIIWNSIEDFEQYSLEKMKSIFFQKEISAFCCDGNDKDAVFSKKERNGYIDVMVPTIFLYTFPKDLYVSFHKRKNWIRIPYERNVEYYIYCTDLFRVFDKGVELGKEWENFIKVYKRYFSNADVYEQRDLDSKFEQHLVQRYYIYKEMNRLYHSNCNFFEENPIFVKWNDNRNCLYVRDGNNRLAFLLAKGAHSVWCRMSKNDYCKWIDGAETEKYIFSMSDKQAETRILLQWMGRRDLLCGVRNVLTMTDNLYLYDAFRKMGISVSLFESTLTNIEEYQEQIRILRNEQCSIINEINYKKNFDLIWVNLACMSMNKKLQNLLNEQSGMIVCEGTKEAVEDFANQVYNKSIELLCMFWNGTEMVYVKLLGKDSMSE